MAQNLQIHPEVIKQLIKLIFRECRIALMAWQESNLEWQDQSDVIEPGDLHKSGTMSGWMRNEREANEYIQTMKHVSEF